MTKIIADQPTDATSDAPGRNSCRYEGWRTSSRSCWPLLSPSSGPGWPSSCSAREACTTLLTSSWTTRPTPRSSV